MATIEQRLTALEQATPTTIMTMRVGERPTPEQQAEIDLATRTGRRLIVFIDKGMTAWLAGVGVPPWEQLEGATYDNA